VTRDDQHRHVRAHAAEWHRRGLRTPAEIDALVQARLVEMPAAPAEVRYADFFRG
jgi:hypothetical protein